VLVKVSTLAAADELFDVTVPFRVTIDAWKEAEDWVYEELNAFSSAATDELTVVKALLTVVIDAAKDALSTEPVPA
jgi:hypothetical protein